MHNLFYYSKKSPYYQYWQQFSLKNSNSPSFITDYIFVAELLLKLK